MHLPQIGASRLKLERKPNPHWKHFRLYICPFGFQRLKMLIITRVVLLRIGICGLVTCYSTCHTKIFQCTAIKWYWTNEGYSQTILTRVDQFFSLLSRLSEENELCKIQNIMFYKFRLALVRFERH